MALCCPQISVVDGGDKHCLEITWKNAKHKATLKADVEDMSFDIIATQPDEEDNELHTYRYAFFTPGALVTDL